MNKNLFIMNTSRFKEIVAKLDALAIPDDSSLRQEDQWLFGAKFPISKIGATLDELREVGQAYGLYIHHCSHCDGWYFHHNRNIQ